ncbi:response regulator transcription factor [Lutibacter sp. B2]|nr:response regulator transcription factor [Lutibacter sp. B2]
MKLRIVLAEDNELLRKSLMKKLSIMEGIEVVYFSEDGEDFVKAVRKIKPDIAITDIDMPKMNGIEAAKKIREELSDTEIIFITSYSEYIKEAVELYAFDYIEKPINILRLEATIERLKRKYDKVESIFQFKTEEGLECVSTKDLYLVEAFQKKTIIYTLNNKFISQQSLKEVDKMLNNEKFFKTSRSYIVNIEKIAEIHSMSRTSCELSFKGKGYKAQLTKKNFEELRKRIKEISR